MPMPDDNTPATVPGQPVAKPPLRRSAPVVIALVVIIALIGFANISSLLRENKKAAPASAMPMRPFAPNAQQVTSFETQQQLQARRDAEERQRQQELAVVEQLQQAEATPGSEAAGAPPMTAAQRAVIYGENPNAPARTSEVSEAQAEAKQRELAREKQQQDAVNSDTLAIDFDRAGGTAPPAAVVPPKAIDAEPGPASGEVSAHPASVMAKPKDESDCPIRLRHLPRPSLSRLRGNGP